MPRESRAAQQQRQLARQVDAVLAASKALVGVAAQSVAEAGATLTAPQLRALVIVASLGPIHLTALAAAMRVHPSNATRTCDRLVADGLLDRKDNPADRRHLALTLTPAGRQVLDGVMERRRAAISEILLRMPVATRERVAEALAEFAVAADEPTNHLLWSMGWISGDRQTHQHDLKDSRQPSPQPD